MMTQIEAIFIAGDTMDVHTHFQMVDALVIKHHADEKKEEEET
jgi:hypothetical protein